MPNLRGPGERKCKLFATVVTSVVLYASPIWGETYRSAPEKITRPLRRLQRTIAIRTIAAYRTTSFDAAVVLARMSPWQLEASIHYRIYNRFRDLKNKNELTDKADSEIRNGENQLMRRQWEIAIDKPDNWGKQTTDAIKP